MSFSGQGSSPIPLGSPDSPGNALPPITCVPFYCPVANYPTSRGLKQHLFVSSRSLGPSLGGLDWVFCSGSHKAKLKVLAGLGSCLEALGKTPPPNSFKVLAGSVPCSCWTEVPISILAFFCGGSHSQGDLHRSLLTAPSTFKASNGILLVLRISPTFPSVTSQIK